jgi:hypothetical protein
VPEIVQTEEVLVEKATAKPEDAVADRVMGVPTAPVPAGLKLMVWLAGADEPPPHAERIAVTASAEAARFKWRSVIIKRSPLVNRTDMILKALSESDFKIL